MGEVNLRSEAFEAIGADAAQGAAVDMWKVVDREGRPFLVVSTHKDQARNVYEVDGDRATVLHLPQDGSAQVINEVGWHLRKEVTREAYCQDLDYADEQALNVCEWRGEDREGRSLVVVWVQSPNGAQLAAYEIQGRA
jgi:hypothetical protein